MAPIFFQFLLLLLLRLINPADSNSNCPKSFPCGNLGTLEFPLSNQTGCGLFMVQNCDTQTPTIELGADGYQYNFLANKSANQLLVSDPYLQYHLNTHFCLGVRNLTLPPVGSPSVTLTILPNITLFACINQTYNSDAIKNRFQNYKYTNCSPWDVYYKNPATRVPVTNLPMDCTVLQVPINSTRNPGSALPNLLSHQFIVEWNVTQGCYECHRGGGQCLSVYCVIWQCKRRKKQAAGHSLSKSVSFDRSSKSDVEGESTYFGIPIFSYAELEVATDNFDPSKELGSGGYGTPDKDMRPSMSEVVDILRAIRGGDSRIEKVKWPNSYSGKNPLSSETDDVVLLKKKNLLASPKAVTDSWVSSSSTNTSSIS
ncbi:probable serine/threonine-protein kinase at1g18390 [Phtheirospermum japonicum]|uniref:Probable serine/threonine-protein kinase at1g18390 n=1 Tax=Phtheirospermum japonicum TaxID=374723 RepID=A0A830BIY4_9LAMI|nr:probable serine/threonine-protein kinase at1g18390 [Phtheirospermum japonicum]